MLDFLDWRTTLKKTKYEVFARALFDTKESETCLTYGVPTSPGATAPFSDAPFWAFVRMHAVLVFDTAARVISTQGPVTSLINWAMWSED